MSKFRTPKKNRTTYIYRDAYGKKIAELRPGEESITEKWIIALHGEDDAVHNATKKDSYHGLVHYEQINNDCEEISNDRQSDLADYAANPETIFIEDLDSAERAGAFKEVWDGLADKQRNLVMKKLLKCTNVAIAKEEGCTEAAVRNRLVKIQKRFEKFLQ